MPEQTILVVSPNWLGDAVMALPALADVRRHFPASRLVIAARPAVSSLFTLVPGVDEVCAAEADAIRTARPDIAILLPNSFATAWLVRRAGVPERWGYRTDVRSVLLTRAIARPGSAVHQGEYYQHLVRALGVSTGPCEPALRIGPELTADARRLLTERGWDGVRPLIVLAPGAAYGKAKQWIPSHVVHLVTTLVRERHATCVLVGSRGDARTTGGIRDSAPVTCRTQILDIAGATTLPLLAGVISLAGACVSNDSGAMHLAAATGTPVVATFGPTNEHATSPLAHPGVATEVLTNPVWCRPCMLRECPIDHRCMSGIDPVRVLEATDRVARSIS